MVTFENPLTFMGGVEVHAMELSRALRSIGVEVTLITRKPEGPDPPGDPWGIPVEWIDLPVPRGPLPPYHHKRLMRPIFHARAGRLSDQADLVHSQDDAGMGALGQRPVVATIHTDVLSEFEAAREPFPRGLLQRAIVGWDVARWKRYADRVAGSIAVSRATARRLEDDLGFAPAVIPNGLRPIEAIGREEARARTGAPFERTIVYLGRLVEVKRPDRVIDVLPALPKDVGLRLAGKGPQREALQDQAEALGVADRVEFLGFVPDEEKLSVLASGDVFVLPSEHEGQPITLLEALSQGVPVVTSDLGWLPEQLHGYAHEAPVEQGHAGLAQAVEDALAQGRFSDAPVPSWEDIAEQTLAVYQQAADHG